MKLTLLIKLCCLIIWVQYKTQPLILIFSFQIYIKIKFNTVVYIMYVKFAVMKLQYIFMIIALICGWLYCMLFISRLFAITSISRQCAMLMVIFAIITEPLLRYLCKFTEWISSRFMRG